MKDNRIKRPDRILLGMVVLLLILGIFMVYSASSFRAEIDKNDSTHFLKRHSMRVLIGLIFLFVFMKIDYHRLRWLTPLFFLGCLGALVVVLMMPAINGVHRSMLIWKVRIQPSEFMKLVLILYLAVVFSKGTEAKVHKKSVFFTHCAILLGVVFLVFIEPDLGTAMVLFLIGLSLLYLGGIHWKRILAVGISPLFFVLIGIATHSYQRVRLSTYIKSMLGTGDLSYHVRQSVIGLAHGGFAGVGYGVGKQKLLFLPEPYNDFILSCIGEELGFLGILILFILIGMVLWRGVHIALHARDRYGYLLAGGITSMILINAIINAGVVANLLPTTGLPFPFISYGGSSLLAHLIGVGILLNISKQSGISYRQYTSVRGKHNPFKERES